MEQLWNLRPPEKGKIVMMGKVIETPRWQQSFGLPYRFSGVLHKEKPIPNLVQKYLDYANTTDYSKKFGTGFNMCLINWYENGSHYIGYHSDEAPGATGLLHSSSGEAVVFSISFGQNRDFSLQPTKPGLDFSSLKIPMPHGTVVVMGGKCQKTHKHSVPKVSGQKALQMTYRINLTFRIFKDESQK